MNASLNVGLHRPIYLWAGPGTIRMNRLKFMNAPVDEAVHHEAYTDIGARRVAEEAACNWAYLTCNWGFPPEQEQEDWTAFRCGVEVFHRHGVRVFGYIQTSNCVYAGSHRERDWYAQDERGRPFYYYTGRYMTCWLHPEWRAHLKEMVRLVVEAGADGVFFDNPWMGAQPFLFGGTWLGTAGCHCPRCQEAFRRATNLEIPTEIDPCREEVQAYLRWRARVVTETLEELAAYARSLNPAVLVSANDFDAVMRPSFLILGIDLSALAKVQDVLMIEDYGLPRWEAEKGLLVNNALTLRVARALAGGTPVSTLPYDRGIGFDGVYPPRRFQQAIAEAAACGAMTVVKGTEFVERGRFTLLTAAEYLPQRAAVGRYHRWLEAHADLYRGWEPAAPVGILWPGEAMWQQWPTVAPLFFGAAQTLTAAGIPWRVVRETEEGDGLEVVLDARPGAASRPEGHPRWVALTALPGWSSPGPAPWARNPRLRARVQMALYRLYRAYFERRLARRLVDRLGMVHFFTQSPYFRLPPEPWRQALLEALGPLPVPRIEAKSPVLVEIWRNPQNGACALHLVNYDRAPQWVQVKVDGASRTHVLLPDEGTQEAAGPSLSFPLDVYAVLLIPKP
ncbi:MAG: hypothetical protein RMK65_07930 [Anaerolineae bacterium]|nr:hypothetical protein [Anaerolineae bacterium]